MEEKDRRKLIFVTGKMVKGGSERVISILANHFAKTYDVRIITLLSNRIEYELDESIDILCISAKDRMRLLKFPLWIWHLHREFNELKKKNAVIISFVARTNVVTLMSNLTARIPIIISERNDPMKDGRGIMTKLLVRFLYPNAGYVVFHSDYAKSLFDERIKEKGRVIPNPIGPFEVHEQSRQRNTFVTVGRLAKQKNQELLIRAFSMVYERHPESSLYIYGEGSLKKKLQKICCDEGIEDVVTFKGNYNDIHNEMVKYQTFVLSSDYEGQSNALLEAMALGMPCIATDVTGHRGLVDDGNALLTEPGNLQQLAEAMIKMLEQPEMGEKLGREAAKRMKALETPAIIDEWDKLLENCHE